MIRYLLDIIRVMASYAIYMSILVLTLLMKLIVISFYTFISQTYIKYLFKYNVKGYALFIFLFLY